MRVQTALAARWICASLLGLGLAVSSGTARATEASDLETRVKAAFLFNFARFTEWPAATEGAKDFMICVAGNDSTLTVIRDTLQNKEVRGKRPTVRALRTGQDGSGCQMVYFAADEPYSGFGELPVLSVGEGLEFPRQGGIVGFHLVDGRLRFAINPGQAKTAGLKISSRLLELADIVGQGG